MWTACLMWSQIHPVQSFESWPWQLPRTATSPLASAPRPQPHHSLAIAAGEFITRACIMKSPLAFLKGHFIAVSHSSRPTEPLAREDRAATRAWKLFLLLPRLLLHKVPRGGHVLESRLIERFADFAGGLASPTVQQPFRNPVHTNRSTGVTARSTRS